MYQQSPFDRPDPAAQSSLRTVDPGQQPATAATGPTLAEHRPGGPTFLDELTRVMHTTATRQREQILAEVAAAAEAQAMKAHARGAAEADELRRLAEQDSNQIRGLAMIEIDRIRSEAERHVTERQERLSENLTQHASIVEGEVQGIDAAAERYRRELDAFFDRLTTEADPVEIARLADHLPAAPDFEAARAAARAESVSRLTAAATPTGGNGHSAAEDGTPTPPSDGSVFTVSAVAARWFRSFMTWASTPPQVDNKPSDPTPAESESDSEPALPSGR